MAAEPQPDPVAALRERLARYSPDRHPLQHATAQFHLGGLLLDSDELEEAETAFATAAALFKVRGARVEHAKALNGLGATLRAAGRLDLAARALEHAAHGLAGSGLEEGAARFNLGRVLREAGRPEAAAAALRRAAELLDPERVPGQAAAAARELGAARLSLGELEEAEAALVEGLSLADRVGDHAGRAAAANTLGIVRLAAGRADAAVEAFSTAVAASPRRVRPEAFAMAKANLALAHERAGAPARARLAARQAIAVGAAAESVRRQAAEVLDRLRSDASDLRTILDDETPQGRELVVHEELARTAESGDEARAAGAREWIEAHAASNLEPVAVAELWLGGLLELPPDELERHAGDAVRASAGVGAEAGETFREAVVRAMARFHIPQWMRLQDVFSRAAEEAGDPRPWR